MPQQDIELYGRDGRLIGASPSRRAAQAVARINDRTMVRLSAVDDETEVTVDKLDAIGTAVRAAEMQVALTAQARKNLELIAPEASLDMAHLAETATLLMSEVLIQGGRRISRY